MTHDFNPADEKYWAEQRVKRQTAYLNQQKIKAAKTNFKQLFNEEILTPQPATQKTKPTVKVLKKRPYRQA